MPWVKREAGLLWVVPLAGPSVGTESFGRGENIGVVIEIPLAIDSLGSDPQALRNLDNLDNNDNSPQSPHVSRHNLAKGGLAYN